MSETGTLSYDEFENELLGLIERAKVSQDSWDLHFSKGKRKVKYLVKHEVKLDKHEASEDETGKTSTAETSWGLEEDNDDCTVPAHLQPALKSMFLMYEYHVVYSHSYSVPVLYFTASKQENLMGIVPTHFIVEKDLVLREGLVPVVTVNWQEEKAHAEMLALNDGKLISLEEVWANVPEVYRKRLEYEKWTFLTQQEHPYLGIPFYQLHPCHTADMMKRALSVKTVRPVSYLVTWLSSVGPVVGLNISTAYSM